LEAISPLSKQNLTFPTLRREGAGTTNTAHPEILGVHMQLVAVKLRQLGVGRFNVIQVLHGFPKRGEHFPAMGTDPGVAGDGGGAGEVPE